MFSFTCLSTSVQRGINNHLTALYHGITNQNKLRAICGGVCTSGQLLSTIKVMNAAVHCLHLVSLPVDFLIPDDRSILLSSANFQPSMYATVLFICLHRIRLFIRHGTCLTAESLGAFLLLTFLENASLKLHLVECRVLRCRRHPDLLVSSPSYLDDLPCRNLVDIASDGHIEQ